MTRSVKAAEAAVGRHRKDVTSAMYFLVWHCGLAYDAAESVLISCRSAIRPLANVGRREGRKCFKALDEFARLAALRAKKRRAP